jgi:tRNA threonylcarbamoyladenosine biosynthesis protein TsaE
VGRALTGGTVVVLKGDLGTGKTTFIRGLAQGLGVEDPESVKSPSYTLVLRYAGSKPLLHMDAYFMRSLEDLELCGMEDALADGDIVAVEWGERIEARIPKRAVWVQLAHLSPNQREIRITIK